MDWGWVLGASASGLASLATPDRVRGLGPLGLLVHFRLFHSYVTSDHRATSPSSPNLLRVFFSILVTGGHAIGGLSLAWNFFFFSSHPLSCAR